MVAWHVISSLFLLLVNILIISQYFWPENFRINDLAEQMVARGHSVTVLTGLPNYPTGKVDRKYRFWRQRREQYRGVEIIRVPLYARRAGKKHQLILNYLSFVISATLGLLKLRGRQFDVSLVWATSPITSVIPAIIYRWITKTPLILWVLDLWPETLKAIGVVHDRNWLARIGSFVGFLYRRCDIILAQSREFLPRMQARGVAAERLKYFPSWSEDIFQSTIDHSYEPAANLPAGFKLVFAGNIGEAQAFDAVVAAAEILKPYPQIHWIILGDGRQASWLQQQVQERGLARNFHLLGAHPLESMPAFFEKADALLVSLKDSLAFSLTIPGKVQSYMAYGKPIVGMLDGEGKRVLSEANCGMVAEPENIQQLATAVLEMSKLLPEQRAQLGRNGQLYYQQHFNRADRLNELEIIMNELTAKDSRGLYEKL